MPFNTTCSLATSAGDLGDCETNKGWHSNRHLNLDSNGIESGIPIGIKFSMKTYIQITEIDGGLMQMEFKMKGFNKNESFKVLINGMLQYSNNTDTDLNKGFI